VGDPTDNLFRPRKHCTPERTAFEKQDWFKKGQCFRNGIEGRIGVVQRTVQLRRCPDGSERWIGMGILVANMVIFARTLYKRRNRKRKMVNFQNFIFRHELF